MALIEFEEGIRRPMIEDFLELVPSQFGIGPRLRHGAPGTPVGLDQGELPSGIPSPEETETLAEDAEHLRQRRAREEQMLREQEQERLSWEPREFGDRFFGEIPDEPRSFQTTPTSTPSPGTPSGPVLPFLPGPDLPALGGGGADDEFEAAIRQLATFLNAPVFSESDEARRRALRFDQMERRRQAARQQVVERLAAQGHGRSSGTVEMALQQVDQAFDALRDRGEAELLQETLDRTEQRRMSGLATLLQIPELRRQAALLGLARGGQALDVRRLDEMLRLERERIAAGQAAQGQAVAAQQQSDLLSGLGLLLGFLL